MPNQYTAPSGPPPSHQQNNYTAPSGPPPSQRVPEVYGAVSGPPNHPPNHDQYAPPPGAPPSRYQDEYGPPSGPPPAPGYHDWQTAVPDTSLLPPPPAFFQGHQRSDMNNASPEESEQGEAWCAQNPLTPPIEFPQAALEAIAKGNIGVIKPRDYKGDLNRLRPGVWAGKTKDEHCSDSSITSTIPLYSVLAHSPLRTGRDKTAYYEVRISKKVLKRNKRGPEVDIALGFAAPPYPTFRLPGWHRGSLAVHGDDGSKFINDTWGGQSFTEAFKPGETIGLGMKFPAKDINAPPSYTQSAVETPINVEVFLTRNGQVSGSWNLHEEGDGIQDREVTGLEGLNDLYAVIGTFEATEFEIVFNESEWMYHP